MIRKIIGLIVVIGLLIWGAVSLFRPEEKPRLNDVPSEQEQKVIEESQPEPAFVPESRIASTESIASKRDMTAVAAR